MKRFIVVVVLALWLGFVGRLAYSATGGYCQNVRYCRVSCGELYAICHNPVQRLTCALAHVLCAVPFGSRHR